MRPRSGRPRYKRYAIRSILEAGIDTVLSVPAGPRGLQGHVDGYRLDSAPAREFLRGFTPAP